VFRKPRKHLEADGQLPSLGLVLQQGKATGHLHGLQTDYQPTTKPTYQPRWKVPEAPRTNCSGEHQLPLATIQVIEDLH
jgi:hypothetical protein